MSYTVSLSKNADSNVGIVVISRKRTSIGTGPVKYIRYRNAFFIDLLLYWYSTFISDVGGFVVKKSAL
jgi:hypothetical protein